MFESNFTLASGILDGLRKGLHDANFSNNAFASFRSRFVAGQPKQAAIPGDAAPHGAALA